MHTLKEICNALKVIQEVCYERNLICEACPLRKTDNDCAIIDGEVAPRDWEFYDHDNIKLIL